MKILYFKEIDSTSAYLKRNYKCLNNFTIVNSDYQTSGHGRLNRVWQSKANDNLLFSILIKDSSLINKYASLSLGSAVAIFQVLKKLKIKNVSIKWPNDVYVNDKKICGILLESISNGSSIDVLIIGIGLNVNQISFNEIENATSIYNVTNKKKRLFFFRKKVFKECLKVLNQIQNDNFDYLKIVRDNNYLLNKDVYALINNEKCLVNVIGINDDNSLKVKVENKVMNLNCGEISFH